LTAEKSRLRCYLEKITKGCSATLFVFLKIFRKSRQCPFTELEKYDTIIVIMGLRYFVEKSHKKRIKERRYGVLVSHCTCD